MAIVELRSVTKQFGETMVVKTMDLAVEKGEFLTFLGPSGCGKTTTLRMIGGFERPTSGQILLGGREVSNLPPYKRDVNTVFQSYALFPHLTVAKNVAYGLEQKKLPRDEIKRKVRECLEMVRMEGFAERKPRELSGGQQQRVAVARAIVNSPSVLLLDEPLGALDLKLRKEMQVELKELQRRLSMTFIYVTHDQEEALTMSDRIAVMNGGKIEQIAPPVDVYNRPKTRFVADFVGETNLLAGEVDKTSGADLLVVNGERIPIEGAVGFEAGQSAYLSIRPEMIKVTVLEGGEAPPPGLALSGTVEETVFVGSMWKTIVKLKDSAKIVASGPPSSHGYLARGTAVLVGWEAGRAVLLAE